MAQPVASTGSRLTYVPEPDATARESGAVLSLGHQGQAVAQIQRALNRSGAGLSADAKLGPRTEAAIRAFQQRRGLPETGSVDGATWAALISPSPAAGATPSAPVSSGTSVRAPATVSTAVNTPGAREVTLDFATASGGPYKERLFVSVPDNLGSFAKPPRIVVYFHGNGGGFKKDLAFLRAEVEKMRAAGDPVVLVVPENLRGHWQDFRHGTAFADMIRVAEAQVGGPVASGITVGSFSGGYEGIGQALTHLQGAAAGSTDAALYQRIDTLGLFDSVYGHFDAFAKFAQRNGTRVEANYTYYQHPQKGRISPVLGGLNETRRRAGAAKDRIVIEEFHGSHGNAPTAFRRFLAPR